MVLQREHQVQNIALTSKGIGESSHLSQKGLHLAVVLSPQAEWVYNDVAAQMRMFSPVIDLINWSRVAETEKDQEVWPCWRTWVTYL